MSNPEFKAFGSARMRRVEKDEPGEFHDANEYLCGSRLAHATGYYLDYFCEDLAVPAVYVANSPDADPWRGSADGDTHYFAAVKDPYNTGCGVVDFEESYADASEAARAAHGLAERYAETDREYNARERARMEAQELLPEDIRYLRRAHSRALVIDDATGARAREEYRERVAEAIKRIRKLRSGWANFKEC
jgi:hypothetical protein